MVFTGHDANTVRTATVTLMVAAGLRPEYTAGIDQWTWKVDAMRMRGMRKESKELSLSALLALCVLLAVSAVWPALAEEVRNRDGVAVIIGNKDYRHERVPEVAYARRDAEAFGRYVVDVLGFDPNRVFELPNATQADMFSWFGNRGSHEGKLWRYLHPRRGSDVVVFYSGHGVPGLKDRRGYLLPSDADPNTAEINGYPIDLLYENLGKLAEATSVRVFLDACFSGDSDQGFLVRSASPVFVQASLPGASGEKLTVLSAASGTEVASWDEKAQHGMFTHYLLDALYGKGDADGDGKVTAREAKIYLDDHMTYAARLAFGRHQNASLKGAVDAVLASAVSGDEFPERPALKGPEAEADAADREKGDRAGEDETEAPAKQVPVAGPADVESGLGLTRGDRRSIQSGLASLGFAAGPADGLFGKRTREAISSWQEAKGEEPTGYLTRAQTEVLKAIGDEPSKAREQQAGLKKDRAGQDKTQAPTKAPSEILLPDGLRLSDWALLAEDRLGREDYRPLLVEGVGHLRAHGVHASVKSIVDRAFAGLVEGLSVTDEASAREVLGSVKRLRDVVGDRVELSVLEAKAYERLGRWDEAAAAYRSWLGLAAPGHPQRKDILLALRRAERGEAVVAPSDELDDCGGAGWCPRMVVVPAGSFTMGSPSSEKGRRDSEGPQRVVTISRPFAVGKYEVTRGEFERFVEASGHSMGNSCWTYEDGKLKDRSGRNWRNPGYRQTDRDPVACVSWKDAKSYVRWLSRETGQEYRLLTESEWEYAARAGTRSSRHWGENVSGQCSYANGADRKAQETRNADWIVPCDDGFAYTAPVGSFGANGFGLHDMAGNVWEWVEDCWHGSYNGAPSDGSAWTSGGNCSKRVLRGGSWGNGPGFLRSANRNRVVSGYRYINYGFRISRTLTP